MQPLLLGPAVLALALGAQAIAADWPQVLGPGRNGVYGGPPLSDTWGAPAHDGMLYVRNDDTLVCLDLRK